MRVEQGVKLCHYGKVDFDKLTLGEHFIVQSENLFAIYKLGKFERLQRIDIKETEQEAIEIAKALNK